VEITKGKTRAAFRRRNFQKGKRHDVGGRALSCEGYCRALPEREDLNPKEKEWLSRKGGWCSAKIISMP